MQMSFTTTDIDRLTGATVRDTGGDKIGSIGQVYVDSDGAPIWATVKTGFFGTSESFVPLDSASFDGDDVTVPFDKDTVKNAPRVESDEELNENETDSLYDYYSARSSGSTAGDQETTTPPADPAGTGGYGSGSYGSGTYGSATSDPDTATGADAAAVTAGSSTSPRSETDEPHEGYDTSGPSTDDSMTRSEERLKVGTQQVETGRARLRKHIVTEQQTVTVPVTHEEATLVREPITDANIGDATAGPELSEEEHEVVLHGEEVVVDKDVVAVERVRLGTQQVTEDQTVTEDVRKEQIDYVDPDGSTDAGTDDSTSASTGR